MKLVSLRACQDCGQVLDPREIGPKARYHPKCQRRAEKRRARQRAAGREGTDRIQPLIDAKGPAWIEANARRGPLYEKLLRSPEILDPLLAGYMSYSEAGDMLGTTKGNVQRMLVALAVDAQADAAAAVWELDGSAKSLLGPPFDEAPEPSDPGWEPFLDELTGAFVEWRTRYMSDEKGVPYITKPFHRNWIRGILEAIFTGGRLLIQSPPRHGKTELLIDFCVWLIVKDPHIRIIWVASNTELASDWCAQVMGELEGNERLKADYLPPGGTWKPHVRSGRQWKRDQFEVATRTRNVKSPSMRAVGRGSRIRSRDADFIIMDDIEDFQSTIQPKSRDDTKKWAAIEVGSRKEAHTAVVVIGSRVHPEDLSGSYIDNPEWSTIIEEAHSSGCDLPELEVEAHVDCMLFPELRTYEWLQTQRRDMQITGGDSLFQMVYQNVAVSEGLVIFDPDAMRTCRTSRVIGDVPPETRLVAGLDPAYAGYQAAVLWAYQPRTGVMFLVDVDNSIAAGIPGWRDLMRNWFDRYGLTHWVVETNAVQGGYMQDAWVQTFRAANGIHLEGHFTGSNKWDKRIGVTGMARLYSDMIHITDPATGSTVHRRQVDLPYGNPESKAKVDRFCAQHIHFSTSASQNRNQTVGYKSDIVMAAWFPMKAIRRMGRERAAETSSQPSPFTGFVPVDWDLPSWSPR
jgi:hypothetical protein